MLASKREFVSDVCIKFAFCDHIPLQFSLVLQSLCTVVKRVVPSVYASRQSTLWHKLYDVDIESCHDSLESVSGELLKEALSCSALDCTSENHKKLLTNLYESIVQAIFISSLHLPPTGFTNRRKVVPGWNEY